MMAYYHPVAGDRRFLMAKQATQFRRKLVGFDDETWHALNLLSRESMKTFQELAGERDLPVWRAAIGDRKPVA
jgi:hypothetical protein